MHTAPYSRTGITLYSLAMDDETNDPASQKPPEPAVLGPLARGMENVRRYLTLLPDRPGVYRMIGADGGVLYVGKAKALRRRVTSYTQPDRMGQRIQRMVSLTHTMEFVETATEAEALLLEANLIKSLHPAYNVLLKDDKMYASIMIPKDHDFPGVFKHRGARPRDAYYYGPFLSGAAINDTIQIMHRVFQIRNCTDSYFAARKRPCLQYHIKRCTAPCVAKVSQEDYANQVKSARAFLDGSAREVQDEFARAMQEASDDMDYETAALYRDKIRALTAMMARQDINMGEIGTADVIAAAAQNGITAIQVFFFRSGQNYGHMAFFPKHTEDETIPAVLAAFIGQFYADKQPPSEIIVSHEMDETDTIESALTLRAGKKVGIICPVRSARRRAIDFAIHNAEQALERYIAQNAKDSAIQTALQSLFGLEAPPQRIEVYDNSHLGGTGQIGAMIVAGPEGFHKNAYRKFNIKDAAASDDYGMMREVMTRRFSRGIAEGNGPGSENWPDLVLIDGGAGQFSAVTDTLNELGILDQLNIAAIAKGPDRNAGREVFHLSGRAPFQLPPHDPVLHYLQRLRDEAHRFAIGSQRARRQGNLTRSELDAIPGIGAKRKKALLMHFGSAKAVADATITDLLKVQGISKAFAKNIHDHFHSET